MKTFGAIVLLSLSLGALGQAVAEPFNDRGIDFVAALPAGPDQPHTRAVVPATAFNDRGVDVLATLPGGSDKTHIGAVVLSTGFNNRN